MSLSKVTTSWANFHNEYRQKNLNCICLIGTQNSGKSTLCQLFNAFIANKKHENLTFDDGKVKMYTLPGIISSNVLKIETLKPIVYQIQGKPENLPDSTIIDVPTFASPPFNQSNKKLWSIVDAKVSLQFLLNSVSDCCFVLVIDQKFTRVPMDGTKSLLINFIDTFIQHPQQLLDSTAIIISKCPSGSKIDTCITRIQKCIQKFEDPNIKAKTQAWFKGLVNRKGIFAFNKFQNQGVVKQQVKQIYKGITKLVPYHINIKETKSFSSMTQDIKEQIKKYLNGISSGFEKLIILAIQIFDSLIKTQQSYQNEKDKTAQLLGIQSQKNVKQQLPPLPSFFNIVSACYNVSKICSSQLNRNIFLNILQEFVKYRIISTEQDLYIFLKQRAQFFKYFWGNNENITFWDAPQALKKLQTQATDIKNNPKITTAIKDGFQQGQGAELYINLVQIIEYFIPEKELQTHELANVWINSSLQLAAKQQNGKGLKKFLQIETNLRKWKKIDLMSNLLAKIAKFLIKADRVSFAVSLFNKCGNPHKGTHLMDQILKEKDIKKRYKINDFVPYLQLLQDLGLYEKSYGTCYFLGDIYDLDQQRTTLKPFLTKPPSAPKPQALQSFLDKKIKGLSQQQIKLLTQLAEDLDKK